MPRQREWATALLMTLPCLGLGPVAKADDGPSLSLVLRSRVESPELGGACRVVEEPASWDPKRTVAIVCDMWDVHHSLNAVRRETEMAPRMETTLRALRDRGVLIVHAPSGCMDAYKEHPARKRAQALAKSKTLPAGIAQWCRRIPAEERGSYPVDQSDGGEDDDPAEHARWEAHLASLGRNPAAPWKSQTDALTIDSGKDLISDDGEEIWSALEDRGITNVILMGVHTNMCVLGRPFGLRQMAKNGKTVVLMRDLTDTMYNPARAPFVSHFTGTDRVVEHVERFVSPSVTSDQVVGGLAFRYSTDRRPRVVFLVAEDEYKTETTLPTFAARWLGKHFAVSFVFDKADDKQSLTGLGALAGADVLVVSARRRAFPTAQLEAVRRHVAAGKAVVGIRTASHAFALRGDTTPPTGHSVWPGFDAEILGGHYTGHLEPGPLAKVATAAGAEGHPILRGLRDAPLSGHGSLYKVSPLAAAATPLLTGTVADRSPEPVAWTHLTSQGGRAFYTSLGHADDFAEPAFPRLLFNGISWAAGINVPERAEPSPGGAIAFPS